jgi:hypothetical protein
MAKQTRSAGKLKRKKKNNFFSYFFIAVIIIAIIAFAITYIVTQKDDEVEVVVTTVNDQIQQSQKDTVKNSKTKTLSEIEGTWASLNDGAMLTISGRNYTLELPNVEGTLVGKGTCLIVGNKVTFVDTDGDNDCNITPGVYTFKIMSDEITFEKVDDKCTSRYSRLSATWFKV